MKLINNYEEIIAWKRKFTIEREGKEYRVSLYWSEGDGYEVFFNSEPMPDWAQNWEDNHDQDLGSYFDDLTGENN